MRTNGKYSTEEIQGARNFRRWGLDLNLFVSAVSGSFIVVFALYALLNLEHASRMFSLINETIVNNFDWLFIISSNIFILVCLFLALSPLGNVRIGGVRCEPEFSSFAWYSMLISAGMGIGLMFWAVGEPLSHVAVSPPIFGSPQASHTAMATTFFHWGLHPWGIYALMSLGLAFFAYNRKLPLSLRSVFYPLFGDRIHGVLGDIIDTFAVLSVLFGLATSLGLGIMQINSGLDYLLGIGFSVGVQVVLIGLITLIAIISVVAGIDRGVKVLSMFNMRLATLFLLAVFLLGPTGDILRLFSNSVGLYLSNLIQYASLVSSEYQSWQSGWTIFYLAWWISWSPFVGMFIARVSRGRTVREMVLGVMIVPSLLSFFWLSVFGETAFYVDGLLEGGLFAAVEDNLPVALFEMLSHLHMPFLPEVLRTLMFILATVLVVNYFITSSDSGSLVVDKLTSGGLTHAPTVQRVFWALLEGLVAAVLLLIGGEQALEALQTAVISAGLPLALVLLLMSVSLVRGIETVHYRQMKILDHEKFDRLLRERRKLHHFREQ